MHDIIVQYSLLSYQMCTKGKCSTFFEKEGHSICWSYSRIQHLVGSQGCEIALVTHYLLCHTDNDMSLEDFQNKVHVLAKQFVSLTEIF